MLKSKLLIGAFFFSSFVFAQTSLEKSRYESASSLIINNSIQLKWTRNFAYYGWQEKSDKVIYQVNLKTGDKQVIVHESDLKKRIKSQFHSDEINDWNLYSYTIDEKDEAIEFRWKKESLVYKFKTKELNVKAKKVTNTKSPQSNFVAEPYWKKFDADSSKYLFGRGHQLYLFDKKINKEFKLSEDGQPFFSYNNNNTVEIDSSKNSSTSAVWIGSQIVSLREDRRSIGEMAIVNSLSEPRPTVKIYKFPTPGDSAVSGYNLQIWDTEALVPQQINLIREKGQRLILPGQLINGRTQLFADRLGSNSNSLYFLRRSRNNENVELCHLNFKNGQISVIIQEKTLPHINEQLFTVYVLENGEILFWSERSGYGQYYRYSKEGKLLNKIGPKGNYVVSKIVEIIDRKLVLEVYGYHSGQNPYYKQYLYCSLDNDKGQLITPNLLDNQMLISDNKKYVLNTFSTISSPNRFQIRQIDGKLIADLGQANIDSLLKFGWRFPELLKMEAADDSTSLYGILYKPLDFDSTKRYPIISSVYPGPQEDFVPQSFTIDDNYHQSLADLGFIVFQIPSRGSSPYRGRHFHSYSHQNMRDYALADNKKAIEDLGSTRPYVDLSKVGIFGHSGGGFMTATAMMTYPDFYKVGVAASGNYDPNIYTQWWGETYHGLNRNSKPNYIPSTLELAPQLKGKLLLITGDVDTNVHPAHTFRLANALIRSGKFFDMMVLPGKDHGLGDWYYQSLIRNYFLSHLK